MKFKFLFLFLWVITMICFVIGITKPAFTMDITMGTFWIDSFLDALYPGAVGQQEYSIIASVKKLLHNSDGGNVFLGVLIMLFSIIFPAIKYLLLIIAFARSHESKWTKRILKYGYWSMLDVFVVAILVVAFKGFPGGSRIIPEIGIYFFACSVVLSNFTHRVLEKNVTHETYS